MILCITCMRKITQMTIDFLSETMEVRRNWHISKKPKVGGKKEKKPLTQKSNSQCKYPSEMKGKSGCQNEENRRICHQQIYSKNIKFY